MDTSALTEAIFYVLLALHEPLHGYGIMQKVEAMSSGRVRLAAGTLYGALSTMVVKGWILPLPGEVGSRRKAYEITSTGKAVAAHELTRLKELVANGEMTIGG